MTLAAKAWKANWIDFCLFFLVSLFFLNFLSSPTLVPYSFLLIVIHREKSMQTDNRWSFLFWSLFINAIKSPLMALGSVVKDDRIYSRAVNSLSTAPFDWWDVSKLQVLKAQ